jgi:hypothetical protein
MESNAWTAPDCIAYNKYMQTRFNEDVEKIKGVPFSEKEIRQFNHDLNISPRFGDPLVEP